MPTASQLRVLSILSNAVGLAALAFLLLVDLPQATGMVIVCGDDAQRPGSLVCISPTPLGLILRAGIATSGLVLGNNCKLPVLCGEQKEWNTVLIGLALTVLILGLFATGFGMIYLMAPHEGYSWLPSAGVVAVGLTLTIASARALLSSRKGGPEKD